MPTARPIVLVDGQLKQLADGDQLPLGDVAAALDAQLGTTAWRTGGGADASRVAHRGDRSPAEPDVLRRYYLGHVRPDTMRSNDVLETYPAAPPALAPSDGAHTMTVGDVPGRMGYADVLVTLYSVDGAGARTELGQTTRTPADDQAAETFDLSAFVAGLQTPGSGHVLAAVGRPAPIATSATDATPIAGGAAADLQSEPAEVAFTAPAPGLDTAGMIGYYSLAGMPGYSGPVLEVAGTDYTAAEVAEPGWAAARAGQTAGRLYNCLPAGPPHLVPQDEDHRVVAEAGLTAVRTGPSDSYLDPNPVVAERLGATATAEAVGVVALVRRRFGSETGGIVHGNGTYDPVRVALWSDAGIRARAWFGAPGNRIDEAAAPDAAWHVVRAETQATDGGGVEAVLRVDGVEVGRRTVSNSSVGPWDEVLENIEAHTLVLWDVADPPGAADVEAALLALKP